MDNWPADQVERWQLDRLVLYSRNARIHSSTQIDQIAASMRDRGWTNPVLADENGTIIAGHGRVAAAQKLGLTEVPEAAGRGLNTTHNLKVVGLNPTPATNKKPPSCGFFVVRTL